MRLSVRSLILMLAMIRFCTVDSLAARHDDFTGIRSYVYQLQDVDLEAIGRTAFDLVIIDYSSTGDEDGEYSASEIVELKQSPGCEKIILAYMSIGEAEDYRFYWQGGWRTGNPSWLGPENPDWEGNYKIAYWDAVWQAIIFSYVDRILAAGFDGAYLDLIDAYEYAEDLGRSTAAQEMVDFVGAIRTYARGMDPDFLVVPQNAAELAERFPAYLDVVDGIGQEDIYYGYERDGVATPAGVTAELETHLDLFLNAGKRVFTVDYPFGGSEDVPHLDSATLARIYAAYERSKARGYIPYCTVRNLNFLTFNPDHANRFHVNRNHTQADDANPGTLDLPWRTVQKGADTAGEGDTVLVHPGDYADVVFRRSGEAGARLNLLASSGGVTTLSSIEFDTGVSYVNVDGFRVQGFSIWGIFLRGLNRHIKMTRMTVEGGEAGVRLTWGVQAEDPYDGPVSDIILENSVIRDCIYTAVDGTPGPCDQVTFKNLEIYGAGISSGESWSADGIAIEKGDSIIVEDCVIHDNGGDGIDLNSRDFDGHSSGIVVRRNHIYRNHCNGIKLWGGGRLENNAVWGQGSTAVVIGEYTGDYELIHNTVAYNMQDPSFSTRNYAMTAAYPGDETGVSASIDLTFTNNIFAFNSSDEMGGPTGIYLGEGVNLTEGHNLYWSREDGEIQAEFVSGDPWIPRSQILDGTWTSASGQGHGDIAMDPLFVSGWPDVDLSLTESSPAVDAGEAGDVNTDLEGHTRPQGSGVDMGAYEYTSSTDVMKDVFRKTEDFNLLINYPNPFNQATHILYALASPGTVRIEIMDMHGRIVRSLVNAHRSEGDYIVVWDGRDDAGRELMSGMYILLSRSKSVKMTSKIILLR